MKLQIWLILSLALPAVACQPKYNGTRDLGDHVYMEYFEINPAGVEEVYLTDSANFRIVIGKYDTEHERIAGQIEGDTIIVVKNKAGTGRVRVVMNQIKLSRDSLTKNKINSSIPLFQFK
jgi:hypothetical protein